MSMQAVYFPTPAEFREWLSRNAERMEFLWVGYYKVGSGKASITWQQSVDEALCFGWIDGIRKSIDAQRYMIRFTVRKPSSMWSAHDGGYCAKNLVHNRRQPGLWR